MKRKKKFLNFSGQKIMTWCSVKIAVLDPGNILKAFKTQKLLQPVYFCQTTWHYCFVIYACLEHWSSFNICLMYFQPLLPTTLLVVFFFSFLSKVLGICEPRLLILIQKFLIWKNKVFGTFFFPILSSFLFIGKKKFRCIWVHTWVFCLP